LYGAVLDWMTVARQTIARRPSSAPIPAQFTRIYRPARSGGGSYPSAYALALSSETSGGRGIPTAAPRWIPACHRLGKRHVGISDGHGKNSLGNIHPRSEAMPRPRALDAFPRGENETVGALLQVNGLLK
jgi:hypothetical protein